MVIIWSSCKVVISDTGFITLGLFCLTSSFLFLFLSGCFLLFSFLLGGLFLLDFFLFLLCLGLLFLSLSNCLWMACTPFRSQL